jgi:pilus assembly protein CpaB
MVGKRSMAVVVAIALAVAASAAAYSGLHSAQQRADKNATLTSVYVIKGVIPQNESASAAYLQGLIKPSRLPVQFVPTGAVTNLALIHNEEAEYNLPAGEVVVSAMFVTPQGNSSLAAATVPKGDVAVTVSVNQTQGVAGLIEPGDKVDIIVNVDNDLEAYLYQLVPVLGVNTTLVPLPSKASIAAQTKAATEAVDLITFAVPREAAARIALANSGGGGVTGGLFLALVGADDAAVAATTISGTNLIPGLPINIGGSNPAPSGSTPAPSSSTPVTGTNLIPNTPLGETLHLGGDKLVPSGVKSNEPTP